MISLIALLVLTLCLVTYGSDAGPHGVPIIVETPKGEPAGRAAVSAGVPFARKALLDCSVLSLADDAGKPTPLQAQVLSRWPDGSCRWVLLDFQADIGAGSNPRFTLETRAPDRPLPNP